MVGKIVTGRGQLPILSNILWEVDKGGLTLVSTNLEMGLRVEIGGKTELVGSTTVPAKNVSEFISSLKSGEVVVELVNEKLKIMAGKFAGTFAVTAAAEFPVVPKINEGETTKMDKSLISEIAEKISFCAAMDESRPVLTGIKLIGAGDGVMAIATDGFRMGQKKWKTKNVKIDTGIVIPAKSFVELSKILDGVKAAEIDMQILSDSNQVIFDCGRAQLVTRVLEGNFPDVAKIIPVDLATKITIEKEELEAAVRAVSIFARENANIIRFSVGEGVLKISAVGGQVGEGEVELEVDVEGDSLEVAFNFRYVLDYLASVKNDKRVILASSGSLTPGVWKVEGEDEMLHLIMPVRI